MKENIILEAKGIKKRFGETVALQGVDINLYRGEIRGLVGENGSGKSTFSSIIAGIQKTFKGELIYKGKPYLPSSMVEALQNGIGMVVQEKGTIPNVTVAENIFLGELNKYGRFGFLNKKELYKKANQALDNIGITNIRADDMIQNLNMQNRKLIEIAKVVFKNPDILVIDETSTALSYEGRQILYKIIEDFKSRNKSVVLISHDLDELMEKCDTLTVLRDGKLIKHLNQDEFEENYIKQLLVGRELEGDYYRSDYNHEVSSEVVLKVENLKKENDLNGINLDLHKGEILGIGGLSHCGMHTLGKVIFGFENAEDGYVSVQGTKITDEKTAMKAGLGYVSKDRDHEALSLNSSIRENISIVGLDIIKKHNLIFNKHEKAYVKEQVDAFNIKAQSMEQYVSGLSGGNKQKVVFAKWMGRNSDILVLDCPTRGVDIGVKQAMYQLIIKLKHEGKSFILISEELSELIGLADRLLIMKDGEITKEFYRDKELAESDIINYMI